MSKRNKELDDAVAALRPEMIAALQRLIRKPSVEASPLPGKPFGADVDACFTEALTLCHELGFETTDLDRYIGWCEIGSGDEMVAVLGHLDVVPEGEGWHHPPYGAEIVGSKLFGRGAIDDKGPVVASLFALKAIRDLGIPLDRRVRLLFGLNEETNDRDVFYYREHGGELPVLGFTPDGEVINVNVLKQAETPGLGTKMAAADNVLLRSVKGQKLEEKKLVNGKLAVAKDGGDVDALTAATISSRAYVDAINRAWMAYKSVATGATPTDVSSGATSAAGDSAEEQTSGPEAQEGGQNE